MNLRRSTVAFSIALLVAFAASFAAACNGAIVNTRSAQNGKKVSLHVGDQLVVSLKANGTTGYAWKIRSVEKKVLKPRSAAYIPSPNPKHLVGSGGVYKLRLKALAKGTTTLRLKYMRGGESGGSYTLRIVVS